MAGVVGIEPTFSGLEADVLTVELNSRKESSRCRLAGVCELVLAPRVERGSIDSQSITLPLSYASVFGVSCACRSRCCNLMRVTCTAGARDEAGEGIEPSQEPSKGAGLPLTEPAVNWCSVAVSIRFPEGENLRS